MPLYEFYCQDCHTIYTFFSPRVDTQTCPACPKCERPKLERRASLFAISKNTPDNDGLSDDIPDLNEQQLTDAMQLLEREAANSNEDDPRAAARMMRELSKAAGLEMNPVMEEAMRRMEAGEDPEALEEELGDALDTLEQDMPFLQASSRGKPAARLRPPKKDEKIYDL